MNNTMVTGRWKQEETDFLLATIAQAQKEGKHVYDGCEKAAMKLYRSVGACYQRFLYVSKKFTEQKNIMEKISQATNNKVVDLIDEIDNSATDGRIVSTTLPSGKVLKITIEIE